MIGGSSSCSSTSPFCTSSVRIDGGMTRLTPIQNNQLHSILKWAWLMESSFLKPIILISSSTCLFRVVPGHPKFLLPSTLNLSTLLKTSSPSSKHVCTSALYLFLPNYPLFLSIPACPSVYVTYPFYQCSHSSPQNNYLALLQWLHFLSQWSWLFLFVLALFPSKFCHFWNWMVSCKNNVIDFVWNAKFS